MDCVFNKNIPGGSDRVIIVKPSSKTYVTGLASSYDETYPKELENRVTQDEWGFALNKINEALFFYWPCFMCLSFGYCFCCCTLGLSFLPSAVRVAEAKGKVQEEIKLINKNWHGKGVKVRLVQRCSTSWLEVELEDMLALESDNSRL